MTGKLPNEFTPPEAIEKRAVLNFHSYFSDYPNWENPVKAWVSKNGREFVSEFGVESFMTAGATSTTRPGRFAPGSGASA